VRNHKLWKLNLLKKYIDDIALFLLIIILIFGYPANGINSIFLSTRFGLFTALYYMDGVNIIIVVVYTLSGVSETLFERPTAYIYDI